MTRVIKPLYMLIKVDVDADIVYNDAKAHTYAMNHCDKLEYELVDYHYPTKYSEREHPFIKYEEIHQNIVSNYKLLYNSWCNTTLD